MTEREMFEEVFKKLSHTFNESLCMIPNTDWYYSSIAQASWEAWQASANREGYKLVPIEPTEEMIKQAEQLYIVECVDIFSAVIGATP